MEVHIEVVLIVKCSKSCRNFKQYMINMIFNIFICRIAFCKLSCNLFFTLYDQLVNAFAFRIRGYMGSEYIGGNQMPTRNVTMTCILA